MLAPAEEPEEAVADDAPPVVTEEEEVTVARVVAVPEEADEALVEETEAEEEEEEEEPSVMLNWFCWLLANIISVCFLEICSHGSETYRLGVDLLGLVAVGEVDGEGVAGRQLAAVDGGGASGGVDVGDEQGADGWVLDLVGQVDAEGILVRRDRVPGDGLGLTDGPDGALGGRGDLQGSGRGGEGQDNQGGHHFHD